MDRWFKLPMNIVDWDWFDDPNTFKLFIYILAKVNRVDRTWQGIELKKGSMITQYKNLIDGVKLSEQSIRTSIEKLVKSGDISKKSTHQNITLSICNRECYEWLNLIEQHTSNTRVTQDQHDSNTRPTQDQHTSNTQYLDIESIDRENREERKNYPTDSKKESSPRFQKPSIIEIAAYCQLRDNGIEAQHFYDYYESVGWKVGNNPMKDWKAAIRTWENKNRQQKPQQEKPKKKWQT